MIDPFEPTIYEKHRDQIAGIIYQSVQERGYPPSVREISEKLERSVAAVHEILLRMRRDGSIDWVVGQNRTIHITDATLIPPKETT